MLVKIVKNSGNSTTSTSAARPGAVMNQPKRRSWRTISLTVATAAIDQPHTIAARAGPRPALASETAFRIPELLLQAILLRELVKLCSRGVEGLLRVLLTAHRQVEFAPERLHEIDRVGEGREFLRRRHQGLQLVHVGPLGHHVRIVEHPALRRRRASEGALLDGVLGLDP